MPFTGQLGSPYSQLGTVELGSGPSAPLPPSALTPSQHAPRLVRTPPEPGFEKRVRFNFDILSGLVNSLLAQGYLQQAALGVWQVITSPAQGVWFVGNGPPPANLGYQSCFYLDLSNGFLYQYQ